jgi:hypothetical protein
MVASPYAQIDTRPFNPTLLEELLAALAMGANLLGSPLTRRWFTRWGATTQELTRPLPGDELVPSPTIRSTRAITIQAPAGQIWAWLVQMGQGRGGLYSYQRLENLARCQIENADRILPELQDLNIGDPIRLGPQGYPHFTVRQILPGRALVLGADPQNPEPPVSWSFNLEVVEPGKTRLIVRSLNGYQSSFANHLMWRWITDPIFFVMERRMLLGIKARAEAYARLA